MELEAITKSSKISFLDAKFLITQYKKKIQTTS